MAILGSQLVGKSISPGNVVFETPADLSGLELWLDAGQGVTADGSNNVTQWVDQSSNGYTLTPFGSTSPVLVASNSVFNNKPTIDFASAEDGLSGAFRTIGRNNSTFTFIVVAQVDFISGDFWMFSEYDSTDLNEFGLADNLFRYRSSAERSPRWRFAGGDSFRPNNLEPRNNASIITFYAGNAVLDSGGPYDMQAGLNGVQATGSEDPFSFDPGGTDSADSTIVGGHFWGGAIDQFAGNIAELMIYDADLTAANLDNLWTYLGDKYGITTTLLG